MKTEIAGTSNAYAGSPTGLTIFWLEVLELAHGNEDDALADRLAMLALRREDLDELFGVGGAARLWSEYAKAFASFATDGSREIARKIRERRYDDVEVQPVLGLLAELEKDVKVVADPAEAPPRESKDAKAVKDKADKDKDKDKDKDRELRTNLPVYTVRLKRTDEADGIRIDTFVYLDGCWRTALKVGRR